METDGFSGNTFPELLAVFPDHKILERTSMNSWDDQNVRDAGRQRPQEKIVVAGLWTEVLNTTSRCAPCWKATTRSTWWPTPRAAPRPMPTHAMDRMIQAGVVPVTWQQVMLEWQRSAGRAKETI